MPDISLCRNETCPLKEDCYRYMAVKDKHQWYAEFKHEDGKCEYFISIGIKPHKKSTV